MFVTMKVIYNYFLPFSRFRAMMFFGVIFARKKYKPLPDYVIRHEEIHKAQAKDCGGYLRYYILYLKYWLRCGYREIPFEVEAYVFMYDKNYLKKRERGAWREYLG